MNLVTIITKQVEKLLINWEKYAQEIRTSFLGIVRLEKQEKNNSK